ncbi:hypothetical protein [Blastococcus sp. SYSU D01042]
MLGFFATERYVAEVAPEPAGAPVLPVAAPARPAGALTEDPDTGSLAAYGSPLAAAAPARARTAPPRNGASAWAAEAARSGSPAARELVGSAVGHRPAAARPLPADDARVDELAGLLGAPFAAPVAEPGAPSTAAPVRSGVARASFPRATREVPPEVADAGADEPASGAPSPFTAALARMVAGDRDVQHAVREALETSEPSRSGSQTAVWSRATHQEEETVGNQVIAPPSTSVDERAELPSWADEAPAPVGSFASRLSAHLGAEPVAVEPVPVVAAPVSREEEIAEVLRAALAEGHSDDALAGILRKVVAGDSPRDALAEPVAELPVVEVVEAPVVEAATIEAATIEAATIEAATIEESPVVESPVVEVPVDEVPVDETVVPEPAVPEPAVPGFDLFAPVASPVASPVAVAPAEPAPLPPVQLWGEAPEPAPVAPAESPTPDLLIWGPPASAAPSLFGAPASEPAPVDVPQVGTPLFGTLFEAPATEAPLPDTLFGTPLVDAPADEVPAVDEPVDVDVTEPVEPDLPAAEPVVPEELGLEPALVLAPTASDPAPPVRPAAMDATTVMPPLSLLPGSSSRGRGLPPVPPRTGRPPVPPSPARAAAPTAGSRTSELATVTRLPVAPLRATPETPELPGLASLADLIEADRSGLLDAADLPALLPVRPARVRIDPPRTPAEVVSRLADLGVPADLLDAAFTAAVAADGTYAALTRALGERLAEAPELPTGAGDVLFVVGPGVETLRAARSLAATLRLDTDRVQWATRGDLVGLAPESSRMSTIDAALRRRQDAAASGTVTIVAVDAPLRTDAYWMAQMLAIWSPVAVWAVVEATRKPEDLEHWIDGLPRVDALVVQDTDLSADPAAVLHRLAAPVAVVDGVRATPHRWASVLCERLESAPA